MTPSIRLSRKSAEVLSKSAPRFPNGAEARAWHELNDALTVGPKPLSSQRKKTEKKRRAKGAEFQRIREAVLSRAAGKCEREGCGQRFTVVLPAAVDHQFGRGKGREAQTVRTCRALCWQCNHSKTLNQPNGAFWWRDYASWAEGRGYRQEAEKARARLAFVEARGGGK